MKKKIFLSFFTIFLLVIIIEIIAAILSLRPSNNNYGWLNAHQIYKNVIKKIETNEYGTRDTFVKDKNKKNIILLGDSQIELAQEKKNMPARLLERYQDNYNVYSFGSWGWGNDQQLLLLKKTIKKIKPKYVILFFTINDINDNFHNIGYLGEKPTFNYNSNGLIYPSEKKNLLKRYLNYSYIYRLTFRAYLFYQNFKYESFQEGNEFQKRNNCKSDNGKSIKKLLESVRDLESFKRQRYKIGDNLKSYTQLSNDEIEKKINDIFYQFLDYRNNYEKITDKKQIILETLKQN